VGAGVLLITVVLRIAQLVGDCRSPYFLLMGAPNLNTFPLIRVVGTLHKAVLLKGGMRATIAVFPAPAV
jgi:3-deoxy-D-arabino-heptulosonate 7-phosphate (DAHP) synthase